MDIWYLKLEARERERFQLNEATVRRIIRKLAGIAGDDLALFAVTPKGVHLVVVADARRAGRISAATALTVRPLVAARLRPTYRQQVRSRRHMLWYVDHLLSAGLEQEGVEAHPALWSGSCFPELIGARIVDGLVLQLGLVLPQYRTRSAFAAVGLSRDQPLAPLAPPWLRAAGAERIVTAVAAALAIRPPKPPSEMTEPAFPDNTEVMIMARRAAARLATIAGLAWSDVAWGLGISERSARRLAGRPVDWRLVNAAGTRLALEDELHRVVLRAPRHSY